MEYEVVMEYTDGIKMRVVYGNDGILVERNWWPHIYTYSLTFTDDELVVASLREDRIAEKENPYYQPLDTVICRRKVKELERDAYISSTHLLARKLASLPLDYYWFFYHACRSIPDAIQYVDEIHWKRMHERSAKP